MGFIKKIMVEIMQHINIMTVFYSMGNFISLVLFMFYMDDIQGDINIIFNSRMELRYDWLIESLEITRGICLFYLHYIYYKTTCLVRNTYKLFTTFSKNTRTHISLYVSIEWMFHTLPSKELHLQ